MPRLEAWLRRLRSVPTATRVAGRAFGRYGGGMVRLLSYALIPVLLGAAVAFLPGVERRFFRPVHTLAFAAALTVVLAELLPGALVEAGPGALLLFVAGIAAPGLLDRAVDRLARHEHEEDGAGLELAFGGLLVHQAVDGLQVGTSGVIEDGMTVVLAVAAHTTPLVAVTVLAYAHHDGHRAALLRALALGVATALGVVVGTAASTTWLVPVEPWLRAAVAGVLLYILGHDLAEDRPATAAGRWTEAAATVIGMAVPLAWLVGSGHHHGATRPAVGAAVGVLLGGMALVQALWLAGVLPRRFPGSGGHDAEH